jgi:TorA maturation chaperone TorD
VTDSGIFVDSLPPEEAARANFYGLLARLFVAPPDAALLEALAVAHGLPAGDPALRGAWDALRASAAQADVETLREAYDDTFIGTGRSPVSLYATAYTVRFATDAPLVSLRAELSALGLARHPSSHEPEDHIAALCEAMRHLVAIEGDAVARQARFFNRWIAPAAQPLCDAVARHMAGSFYEHVARLAQAFLEVERCAFEMADADALPGRAHASRPPLADNAANDRRIP